METVSTAMKQTTLRPQPLTNLENKETEHYEAPKTTIGPEPTANTEIIMETETLEVSETTMKPQSPTRVLNIMEEQTVETPKEIKISEFIPTEA